MQDSRYDSNSFLKYINKPSKIILWDMDEGLSFLIPFALLCAAGKAAIGIVFGLIFFNIVRMLKLRVGISSLSHAIYWYFPTSSNKFVISIPSYKREYIG